MGWLHGCMGSSSARPTCVTLLAEEWAGLAAWLGIGLGLGLGLATLTLTLTLTRPWP